MISAGRRQRREQLGGHRAHARPGSPTACSIARMSAPTTSPPNAPRPWRQPSETSSVEASAMWSALTRGSCPLRISRSARSPAARRCRGRPRVAVAPHAGGPPVGIAASRARASRVPMIQRNGARISSWIRRRSRPTMPNTTATTRETVTAGRSRARTSSACARNARRMRPPSIGSAGIRLKPAMTKLIQPTVENRPSGDSPPRPRPRRRARSRRRARRPRSRSRGSRCAACPPSSPRRRRNRARCPRRGRRACARRSRGRARGADRGEREQHDHDAPRPPNATNTSAEQDQELGLISTGNPKTVPSRQDFSMRTMWAPVRGVSILPWARAILPDWPGCNEESTS